MASTQIALNSLPSIQINVAAILIGWWLSPPCDHPLRVALRKTVAK